MFSHCFLHCTERSTTVWSRCVVHCVVVVSAWVQLFRKPLGWYRKYTFRSLAPVWIMLLDWVRCSLLSSPLLWALVFLVTAFTQYVKGCKRWLPFKWDGEQVSTLLPPLTTEMEFYFFYFLLTTYLLINGEWSFREGAVYQLPGFFFIYHCHKVPHFDLKKTTTTKNGFRKWKKYP